MIETNFKFPITFDEYYQMSSLERLDILSEVRMAREKHGVQIDIFSRWEDWSDFFEWQDKRIEEIKKVDPDWTPENSYQKSLKLLQDTRRILKRMDMGNTIATVFLLSTVSAIVIKCIMRI